jgi:hypothetical protein
MRSVFYYFMSQEPAALCWMSSRFSLNVKNMILCLCSLVLCRVPRNTNNESSSTPCGWYLEIKCLVGDRPFYVTLLI